jgi:tetratricopeptide (TPR) repeat protein
VFTVHASSSDTIKKDFARIGKKYGELEETESAGRHWLEGLNEKWLLIIDNADDPTRNLRDLFPGGDSGHILITTRNPNFRREGSAGSLELQGMEEHEALQVLLRRAEIPKPWDAATRAVGGQIAKTLGYLALALIQAGSCIYEGVCTLKEYLSLHFTYRAEGRERRSSSSSVVEKDEVVEAVYSAFDVSLNFIRTKKTLACQDAEQLLNIVGFYHFDNIKIDIFKRAVKNRKKSLDEEKTMPRIGRAVLNRLRPPDVFPGFLKGDGNRLHDFRVARAISELRSLSLVNYDGKSDSISLHPLVHFWARDRLGFGERKIWAAVALNTLTESIQLPPNDTSEADGEFRNDLLPHLGANLSECPIRIPDYRGPLTTLRIILQPSLLLIVRQQVLSAAKCGYVYVERGQFGKAAELLSMVKTTLVHTLGYRNEKTMIAMLGLAGTYWGLGRLEEAIILQSRVVTERSKVFGPNHQETVLAMDQLGRAHWLHGQYHEALGLQQRTSESMKEVLGAEDPRTLSAFDNLGVTLGSWHRYEESMEVHSQVLASRKRHLGDTHLDTLSTMNNLAMALVDLQQLEKAKAIMTTVHEERKKQLGKEHPWTLWALCNLAKVNIEIGLLDEAEEMLTWGVAAGERSLSKDHLGVLMGCGELSRVYARQGRLDEAEKLSVETIALVEKSRGAAHPDYVFGLWKLAQLYELKGEMSKAISTCESALERVDMRLTRRHPLSMKIEALLQRFRDTGAIVSEIDETTENADKPDNHLIRRFKVRQQLTW